MELWKPRPSTVIPKFRRSSTRISATSTRSSGKFEQADALLQTALAQHQSLYGATARSAEALLELGLLRDAQGKFDDAERYVRQALAIDRQKLSPTHPALARATSALGKVLEDRGSYDASIQVLEEAARLQSARGGSHDRSLRDP